MNRKLIYNALGISMKHFIAKNEYPSIDSSIISDKNCKEIRSHLYGLASDDAKLKEQMVRLLSRGIIEEIREKEDTYIFLLNITYKSEHYLVELKLKQFEWSFTSLHYVGEASKVKKYSVYAGLVTLMIGFIAFLFFYLVPLQSLTQKIEDVIDHQELPEPQEITENNPIDVSGLSLDQIENAALQHQHKLIPITEYDELNQTIMELKEREKEATEKNQTSAMEAPGKVSITIRPGMQSSEIATLVYEAGLARSQKEISQLFTELQIHNKIRAGTFEISTDATYFDLINTLTKQ